MHLTCGKTTMPYPARRTRQAWHARGQGFESPKLHQVRDLLGSAASGARRRGRNEGSIYKDEAKGRWYGAVSLGYGPDGQTWRRWGWHS
jgi:hypothetical protein